MAMLEWMAVVCKCDACAWDLCVAAALEFDDGLFIWVSGYKELRVWILDSSCLCIVCNSGQYVGNGGSALFSSEACRIRCPLYNVM